MSTAQGLSQVLRQGIHPDAGSAQKRRALRVAVNEVVGRTFFGSMLKMARNSAFKTEIGHGGRGEEIFRAQLDEELITRISQSSQIDFLDAMYERLARRYPSLSPAASERPGENAKQVAPVERQVQEAYSPAKPGDEETRHG